MAQTYYVVSGRYHWSLPKKMQILLGYSKSLTNVAYSVSSAFYLPEISHSFIFRSSDPWPFLSLFPRINCLRGSRLKGSSTILSVNGDSFLLGRLSSFVMLLPVSSPQAPGHHLSCAGGVQDLVELPREGYLRSNLFHMRLIWANAQPCDPWWSCLAVWIIVLVFIIRIWGPDLVPSRSWPSISAGHHRVVHGSRT